MRRELDREAVVGGGTGGGGDGGERAPAGQPAAAEVVLVDAVVVKVVIVVAARPDRDAAEQRRTAGRRLPAELEVVHAARREDVVEERIRHLAVAVEEEHVEPRAARAAAHRRLSTRQPSPTAKPLKAAVIAGSAWLRICCASFGT